MFSQVSYTSIAINSAVASTSVATSSVTSVVVGSSVTSTTATIGGQGVTATTQSTTSVVASSSTSSGYSGNSPQLFWIMINNYQIIEVFLLLEADLNEAMISMLEQINFATFNLDWIQFSFLTDLQDKIK